MHHTLFGYFFAVVLHHYSMKLPSYMFYGENVVCVPVHLFLTFIFTLVTASFSHLHRRYKISCFCSNEIGLRFFLFLALALSLFSTLM